MTELNLARNQIGTVGAQYLSDGLDKNTVMFNLLIQFVCIFVFINLILDADKTWCSR